MFLRKGKVHFYIFLSIPNMLVILAKTVAEYDFDVYPVDTCPLSKQGWDKRSNKLKCNKTHGYHCVPNKHLTSLTEFCYPKGVRIPFEHGNCLELAGRGTLNQVSCKGTFSSGCPETFYFSQDLYKHPKCLAINTELRCFDADVECIYSRMLENRTGKFNTTTTVNNGKEDADHEKRVNECASPIATVLGVMLGLMMFINLCLVFYLIDIKKQEKRGVNQLQLHELKMHIGEEHALTTENDARC